MKTGIGKQLRYWKTHRKPSTLSNPFAYEGSQKRALDLHASNKTGGDKRLERRRSLISFLKGDEVNQAWKQMMIGHEI